ncbi:MAG TPA: hypothetical protein VIJ46_02815 [Rhabdochlamydiaceae bacterium]
MLTVSRGLGDSGDLRIQLEVGRAAEGVSAHISVGPKRGRRDPSEGSRVDAEGSRLEARLGAIRKRMDVLYADKLDEKIPEGF